jgi:hypothetical protein
MMFEKKEGEFKIPRKESEGSPDFVFPFILPQRSVLLYCSPE